MLKSLSVIRKLLSEKAFWFSILLGVATTWALALALDPRPRLEINIDFVNQTWDATSRDRRFLAMVSRDASEVEVWDVTRGSLHQTLRLIDRHRVPRAAFEGKTLNTKQRTFAHDNKSFALLQGDGFIAVWDVDSGALKSTHWREDWADNSGAVLNFDRSGRLVVAIPDEDHIELWDVTEERVFITLDRSPLRESRHYPNIPGCLVTCEEDRNVKAWDLATGELLFHLRQQDWLGKLLLSDDRSKLMMKLETGARRIIDLKTGTEHIFELPPAEQRVADGVDLSPDGTRLTWIEVVSDDASHPIVKWLASLLPGLKSRGTAVTHVLDLTTGKELGTKPGGGLLCGAQPLLMASDDLANRLLVYDLPLRSPWPRIVGYACLVASVPYLISLLLAWRKRRRQGKRISLVS